MTDIREQAATPADAQQSVSELVNVKRLLRARELAWLRLQKEAQARQQCRQL